MATSERAPTLVESAQVGRTCYCYQPQVPSPVPRLGRALQPGLLRAAVCKASFRSVQRLCLTFRYVILVSLKQPHTILLRAIMHKPGWTDQGVFLGSPVGSLGSVT